MAVILPLLAAVTDLAGRDTRSSEPPAAAAPSDPAARPAPDAPRERKLDEEVVEAPPIPMSAEALCLRGDHFLDDASRAAILESKSFFEQATRYYPGVACGHAGLSRCLLSIYSRRIVEDDALISQGIDEARRAIAIDPNGAVGHAALAGALLGDLRPDEAQASIQSAVALSPDSIPVLQTLALVRMAGGHLEAARAAIERALLLRPDLPVSHHMLGNVQILMGRKEDSIDSYRNALRLSPDYVPSILQMAAAYEELGNVTGAGRIWRDFLQDHPEESSRAFLYTGRSLMKRNSWTVALGALDKASFKTHKGLSNGTVLYLKGLCYEQLGRTGEARSAFRDVIDNWPDATIGFGSTDRLVFPAYEGLGRLHLRALETEQAQSVMEEGIARSGASLDLYLRLATLYLDYHLPERAAALLDKALVRELDPGNANKLLAVYRISVRLAMEAGDRARIDRLIASLDTQMPRLAAMHDYVHDLDAMRVYSMAGRGNRALEILRRGLKAGYVSIDWLWSDPDLEVLRATDGFKELARAARPGASPSY
jgi:tetratricopeptide (TPR) repeat protein